MDAVGVTPCRLETPSSLVISTGHLAAGCLAGKVAIVTGGGRSIGLEASRALLWMGSRVVVVNLRGPVLLAKACLPGMIERKSGVFVCVSSAGGPYQAAYESLKAAQVALAGSLET